MNLQTPLLGLSGIGPNLGYRLDKLGLHSVYDLITHFPFRYDDFSNVSNTLEAKEGERVTLVGEIWSIKNVYTRSRKVLTQAIFNDGNFPIDLTWFNQSWLTKQVSVGDKLQVSGKLNKYKNRFQIVAPVWEKLQPLSSSNLIGGSIANQTNDSRLRENDKNGLHTGRLVPVYPETMGLTSKWLRTKIDDVLPKVISEIEDPLPEKIKDGMLDLQTAIKKIHFPDSYDDVNSSQERLGFDELFYIQLATQKARSEWRSKPTVEKLQVPNDKLQEFLDNLPYALTSAQKKVIQEIASDLQKEQPMNRLVQGEVGSGKTVVAAVIAYLVYLNGLKTLYMAPTEILAFQHHSTFSNLLESLGISIGIYTGSKKFTKHDLRFKNHELREKNRKSYLVNHKSSPDIIIGTHALISESLVAEDVGLVIIDEQQRFGVEQRTILRNKAKVPHFLTMTATPIPRTVALTLYGDLDLSVIDELPKDRIPVKTHYVPEKKRADAYKFIESKVKEGDQVYIVTPLIELSESIQSAKAAKVEFERLKSDVFPNLRLDLLHGKLKPKEKDEVITRFKNHETDILVSTSVVEVGVDVSNATIMVIEGAERFGLSQLHQLRGRVGRGNKQSYCLLFPTDDNSQNRGRLKNLETISDGLKLAELDMKIRGSGEIFGKRQSGRFELKIASLADLVLIEKTRGAAREILEEDPKLEKYPQLKLKLAELTGQVAPD